MMNPTTAFLIINQAWGDVVPWVKGQLGDAGLQLRQTFDLQVARQAQADCPCPHHGTAHCDCQMLVLLVYRNTGNPITLIIHGYDAKTWLSLVDIPGQRAESYFEILIRRLLSLPISAPASIESVYASRLSG